MRAAEIVSEEADVLVPHRADERFAAPRPFEQPAIVHPDAASADEAAQRRRRYYGRDARSELEPDVVEGHAAGVSQDSLPS